MLFLGIARHRYQEPVDRVQRLSRVINDRRFALAVDERVGIAPVALRG